jgi:hypothetical protein
MTPPNEKTLKERIKSLLTELTYLQETQSGQEKENFGLLLTETVKETYFEDDCGFRHSAVLQRLLISLAYDACQAGIEEMEGQSDFYDLEAKDSKSDIPKDDALRFACEYEQAAWAFARSATPLRGLGDRLSKRLIKSGI